MAVPTLSTELDWNRIIANLQSNLPGATRTGITQELFRCAVEFTRETNLWQELIPVPVEANVTTYPLVLSHEGTIVRLLLLYDPLVQPYASRWAARATMRVPGQLVLFDAPSQALQWTACVAKSCSDPSSDGDYPVLDAWIVEKYNEAFYFGTMQRMMLQTARPWSNPKMGAYYQQQFQTQKSRARTDNQNMGVYDAQAWRFPQGFSTVSRKGWH